MKDLQWFKIYVNNNYVESFRGILEQAISIASSENFAKSFHIKNDDVIAIRYDVEDDFTINYARKVLGATWIEDSASLSLELAVRHRDGTWTRS